MIKTETAETVIRGSMPTTLNWLPGQRRLAVDELETPAPKPTPGRRVNAWLPAGLVFGALGALAALFVSAGWLGDLDRSIVMALNREIFGRSVLADHVLEQLPWSIFAAPLMTCGVWWLLARERDPARWSRLVVGLLAVAATAGISLALQHSFLPFSPQPFMTMNLVTSEALSGTSATQRIPIRLQRFCGRYRNLHSVQQPPHGGGRIHLGLGLVLG